MKTPALLVVPIIALAAAALAPAQVGRPGAKEARFASELTVDYTFSGEVPLERAGTSLGDLSHQSVSARWQSTASLPGGSSLVYGLEAERLWLDVPAGAPVPEKLGSVALLLGYRMPVSDQWSATLTLRPGVYSDFEDVSGRDFNLPVLLTATYVQSRELAWVFGLNVNLFNENPVLPAAGVRWQFAPGWTFALGYPRTGFSYQVDDRLSLGFGATADGGSYHVGRRMAPGIRRTLLDFTEYRVGVSATWRLAENLAVTADAGTVLRREFDYFDKGWGVHGNGGGVFSLSVRGQF